MAFGTRKSLCTAALSLALAATSLAPASAAYDPLNLVSPGLREQLRSAAMEGRPALDAVIDQAIAADPGRSFAIRREALMAWVRAEVLADPQNWQRAVDRAAALNPSLRGAIMIAANAARSEALGLTRRPYADPYGARRAEAENRDLTTGLAVSGGIVGLAGAIGGSFALADGDDDDGGGSTGGTGDGADGGDGTPSGEPGAPDFDPGNDDDLSQPPGEFANDEFAGTGSLAQIGADYALARNATGAGVTVAVLDGAVDIDHPEFSGRISGESRNLYDPDNPDDLSDADDHGTAVAGIIAAARDGSGLHGVAPAADIMSLQVGNSAGGISTTAIIAAVEHLITTDAVIMNGSYGFTASFYDRARELGAIAFSSLDFDEADAYLEAAEAGKIMVFAAGNEFADYPDIAASFTNSGYFPYIRPENHASGEYGALFTGTDGSPSLLPLDEVVDYSALQPLTIVVAAVDANNEIADFSNRCGVAADWCLVAPGVGITSTVASGEGQYEAASGTSFAAPHVAGAAAVLVSLFPELTTAQVVERLLVTATDLGEAGTDAVYGRGLLNLRRATRPIGETAIALAASVDGETRSLESSRVQLSSPFGSGAQLDFGGQRLSVIDSFGAGFTVDLAAFAKAGPETLDVDRALRRFGREAGLPERQINDTGTLSLLVSTPNDRLWRGPGQDSARHVEAALTQGLGEGVTLHAQHNRSPGLSFGLAGQGKLAEQGWLFAESFTGPYLALAEQGTGAAIALSEADGSGLVLGGFVGRAREDDGIDSVEAVGMVAEWRTPRLFGGQMAFQTGALVEQDSLLGARFEGAFALGGAATTLFGGASAWLEVTGNTLFLASLQAGRTSVSGDGSSLVQGVETVISTGWSLGVERRDLWLDGDVFRLALHQPLKVTGGALALSLPSGVSADRQVLRRTARAALAPTGTEIDLEIGYARPFGEALDVSGAMMLRRQPDHDADTPWGALGLVRVNRRF